MPAQHLGMVHASGEGSWVDITARDTPRSLAESLGERGHKSAVNRRKLRPAEPSGAEWSESGNNGDVWSRRKTHVLRQGSRTPA